jgi:transposase InsO family protein
MQDEVNPKSTKEQERLIDAKISLLHLAKQLGNIQKACKAAGIARSSFYDIKRAYEQFGRTGLLESKRGRKAMPIPIEIEERVLAFTRDNPSMSYVRLTSELQMAGHGVGESIVKRVWQKHGLERKLDRYLWLDREAMEGRGVMTENAIKAVRRLKALNEASDNHVEVSRPGELLSQDLDCVGAIKGIGRIYTQAAVDCYTSMAFVRLCTNKRPMDAVALVHEKVLPFFDSNEVKVEAILTNGGREYCGRADRHFYELYLGSQNIEHRVTRPASPWTNGFVERFHRTLKDEFFAKAFREKWYDSLEELQNDLDAFIFHYNERRSHSGYRTKGRTPLQAFRDFMNQPNQEKTAA